MLSLAVHGGAWDIPAADVAENRRGLIKALQAGWEILAKGGASIDAVEEAIRIMEDDEIFDAGRGSFLNRAGTVEMDAAMMEGKDLRAGAVAAVQNIRNPIRAARRIMEEGEYVLLVGMGATRFAREHHIPTCEQDYLITARELKRWRNQQDQGESPRRAARSRRKTPHDTVGAVACDSRGNFAAGTSTGGTPNKFPGRVGDSPLIGSGCYADNTAGAVSATGRGEGLIRVVMAKTVIDLMGSNGRGADDAAHTAVKLLEQKVGGEGGVIALDRNGVVGCAFNTPRMARGWMNSEMKTPKVAV